MTDLFIIIACCTAAFTYLTNTAKETSKVLCGKSLILLQENHSFLRKRMNLLDCVHSNSLRPQFCKMNAKSLFLAPLNVVLFACFCGCKQFQVRCKKAKDSPSARVFVKWSIAALDIPYVSKSRTCNTARHKTALDFPVSLLQKR